MITFNEFLKLKESHLPDPEPDPMHLVANMLGRYDLEAFKDIWNFLPELRPNIFKTITEIFNSKDTDEAKKQKFLNYFFEKILPNANIAYEKKAEFDKKSAYWDSLK